MDGTTGSVGLYPSLVFDPSTGEPRISYYDGDPRNRDLRYACRNGSSWSLEWKARRHHRHRRAVHLARARSFEQVPPDQLLRLHEPGPEVRVVERNRLGRDHRRCGGRRGQALLAGSRSDDGMAAHRVLRHDQYQAQVRVLERQFVGFRESRYQRRIGASTARSPWMHPAIPSSATTTQAPPRCGTHGNDGELASPLRWISANDRGMYSSIALDARPASPDQLFRQHAQEADVRFVQRQHMDAPGNIDPSSNVGMYSSLRLKSNGKAVIAYYSILDAGSQGSSRTMSGRHEGKRNLPRAARGGRRPNGVRSQPSRPALCSRSSCSGAATCPRSRIWICPPTRWTRHWSSCLPRSMWRRTPRYSSRRKAARHHTPSMRPRGP